MMDAYANHLDLITVPYMYGNITMYPYEYVQLFVKDETEWLAKLTDQHNNIYVTGVLKVEGVCAENIFKQVVTIVFLNLVKIIDPQTEERQQNPSKRNMKKMILKHIIEFSKSNNEDKS